MQQLVNTAVPFGSSLPKAAAPEAVERAIATGEPQVTGLFWTPVVNRLLFGIIVPVTIAGESRYVLGRAPDQHTLARLVAANELPVGWHAAVSDSTHRIIAQSAQDTPIGKVLPASEWRPAGPGSVFEFIDSEGRTSLKAYVWSELTGWQTSVWAPKALLEAPVRALWWILGVMALLAFTLVIVLALWLGRIIARSVGNAARAAIALGDGSPLPLTETPVAEVDTLMAELQEAAARRQMSDDLLRESEATFRAMFDVSSVGKVEVEHQSGRFLRANAAMCKFVGYSEAELLARTVFDITHPADLDRNREMFRRMVTGQLAVFDEEKRYTP
jgi:PAS domain-containing protein